MEQSVSFDPDYSGAISGIERDLAKKINDNIYVSPDELITITADYFDGDSFLFHDSYLLFKATFERLNLKNHYEIHSEEEEAYYMQAITDVTSYGCVSRRVYNDYIKNHNWQVDFGRG